MIAQSSGYVCLVAFGGHPLLPFNLISTDRVDDMR